MADRHDQRGSAGPAWAPEGQPAPGGRRTRRTVLASGALATAGILGLARCTIGPEPAPRSEAKGAAQLTILYGGGGPEVRALYEKSAYAKFMEKFPGSTINMDDAGNPMSKLLTMHVAGTPFDIFQGGDTWTYDVDHQQLGLALDDKVKVWPARNDFVQSAWVSAQSSGKQFGLPLFVTARMMYLRKSVLDEVGITKPAATWEELVDTFRRSTKVEGGRMIRQASNNPGGGDAWWWFFWILDTTQATLFKDGKAAFNGGEGEVALQYMKDLESAIFPIGVEPLAGNAAANWPLGTVAHAWIHLAPYQELRKTSERDYQEMIMSTPQVPGGVAYRLPGNRKPPPHVFVDNALLFVSSITKFPDHAFELSTLFLEPETLLEFERIRGRLSPRKSNFGTGWMADPKIKEIAAVYEKHGHARFNPPNFDRCTAVINQVVWDTVRDQKISVKEGLGNLTRELENIARDANYTGTTRSH
jgi:ABC-type glycerol-3-phosphate transport system substrate-binding protein